MYKKQQREISEAGDKPLSAKAPQPTQFLPFEPNQDMVKAKSLSGIAQTTSMPVKYEKIRPNALEALD